MMEITSQFRDALRVRIQAYQLSSQIMAESDGSASSSLHDGHMSQQKKQQQKHRVFFGTSKSSASASTSTSSKNKKESPFIISSTDIFREIEELKHEVVDYQQTFVRSGINHVTQEDDDDLRRQLIDCDEHVGMLHRMLDQFDEIKQKQRKQKQLGNDLSQQRRAHYHAIVTHLKERLRDVRQQYETVRLMKRDKIHDLRHVGDTQSKTADPTTAVTLPHSLSVATVRAVAPVVELSRTSASPGTPGSSMTNEMLERTETDDLEGSDEEEGAVKNMSAEQVLLLEQENHRLHTDLNYMVDQTRDIESRAEEVAQLLSIFSAKVEEQHEQIESIFEEVVSAQNYVQDANENLTETIQRGSRFRIMVLVMFLVASLGLLFLDRINS